MNERDQLVIDLAGVFDAKALHVLLASSFGFPDYYGENWDAFDECIRDVQVPSMIAVAGINSLAGRLPREAELLLKCLSEFSSERAGVVQVHVS